MEQELPGAGDQQLSEGATAQGAEGGEAGKPPVSTVTFKLANSIMVHASSDNVSQENLQKMADLLMELHPPTDADTSPLAHIVLGGSWEASMRYAELLRNTSKQDNAPVLGVSQQEWKSEPLTPESLADGFARLEAHSLCEHAYRENFRAPHFNTDYLRSIARPPADPKADLALFNALGADALGVDYNNIEHRMAALHGRSVHNIFIDEVMHRTNPRPRRLSRSERKLRKLKRMSGNLK